ncbi:MAG: VOC family protein [Actinomycetes bacterium]|jgi:catechol 2,3-dioxygenase
MNAPTFRLRLGHATVAARDLDAMVTFYTEVLGFLVTNRGEPVPGMGEMAFISQTPEEHHQIVLVHTPEPAPRNFVLADHLAFHVDSLDQLRELSARLSAAGNTSAIPINHGNAWSVYFTDPEGNGLECYLDTPFHVAQPFGDGLDLSKSDAEIEEETRRKLESQPEFQPFPEWRRTMAVRLAGGN